jgi:hypothetical protein
MLNLGLQPEMPGARVCATQLRYVDAAGKPSGPVTILLCRSEPLPVMMPRLRRPFVTLRGRRAVFFSAARQGA